MSALHLDTMINEQLYKNIYLLTLKYPTTTEFDAHFKKDMFTRSNKAAFQHVMHFLFIVLDPEKVKKQIEAWPILDVKMEVEFRNQVANYLKEITEQHGEENVPMLQKSHLISPGGPRFSKFLWKLSTFILLQDMNKSPCQEETPLLLPPKVHPGNPVCTDVTIKNINCLSDTNLNLCVKEIVKKEKLFQKNKQTANEISEQTLDIEQELECLTGKILDLNTNGILVAIDETMNKFDDYLHLLNIINITLEKSKTLLNVCCNKDIGFTSKVNNADGEFTKINILKICHNLQSKLNQVYLQLTPFQIDVKCYLAVISSFSENLGGLNKTSNQCLSNLNDLLNKLNQLNAST